MTRGMIVGGGVRLLAVLAVGPSGAPVGGDGPAGEVTAAQREQLGKEASRLSEEVLKHYQGGRFVEGVKVAEQALAIFKRLYPADRYPQGHPELAQSLNNLGGLLQSRGRYDEALGYHEQA